MKSNPVSRRNFLQKTSTTLAGITTFTIAQSRQVFSSEANSKIQMGIIGVGGRSEDDGRNLIKTGKVKIIALADYFDFQLKEPANEHQVEASRCFSGLDAYKQLLALKEVDAVLLTTPPYFRPIHFAAAVEADKHVFAEKPIAVDPWGCRTFLETGKKAAEKQLVVGAGLQSRYDEGRKKIAKLIAAGAIGKPLVGHSTRMSGDLWRRERPASFSERDHQVRHWLYYQWGSGDFIVEMHIHNLDIFNWFIGKLPLNAVGKGGREVRLDVGDIYDHIQVIYEYPDGFTLSHTGTQFKNNFEGGEKRILGTDGYYDEAKGLFTKDKQTVKHGDIRDSTLEEMKQFTAAVLKEIPYINNSEYVGTSTFMCILGREAAYSGRKVTWEELWKSEKRYELPS